MEMIFYYGEQINEGDIVELKSLNEKHYGVVLKDFKVAFYNYDNDKDERFNIKDLGKVGCRFETIKVVKNKDILWD